jgi:hypothetical protein
MKRPATSWTGEQFADLLRLSRQFSEEEARTTMERWQLEAGDTAEVSRFIRWLVARGYMTESQANDMLRDHPVLGGPQAAPAVPVAQAPPGPRPEGPAAQAIKAAIVAPAANPRANPARAASQPDANIDVELVAPIVRTPVSPPALAAAPIRDAEIFDLANSPPPAPKIDVDAVAPAEQPAPISNAPAVEKAPLARPFDWTNIWLYLFLGALGLLAAEFAGWLLAQVAARVL